MNRPIFAVESTRNTQPKQWRVIALLTFMLIFGAVQAAHAWHFNEMFANCYVYWYACDGCSALDCAGSYCAADAGCSWLYGGCAGVSNCPDAQADANMSSCMAHMASFWQNWCP